ncbi:DUF4170 domain-containing protein [Blastochloris tepida]|jgi:hypothetical protein|nr:DUF4170 domain-containing protein [Blastochloris tepida]
MTAADPAPMRDFIVHLFTVHLHRLLDPEHQPRI